GNIARHLRNFHQIVIKRTYDEVREDEEENGGQEASVPKIPGSAGFAALISRLEIEKFRQLLLRWIIQCQILYSAVERTEFRDLLLYLQPSLERYLIRSHQTIGNWVGDEYRRAQAVVKEALQNSRSRIHLSFDIWTSPSALPILGICAHFLSVDLQLRHPLLGLKVLDGSHT